MARRQCEKRMSASRRTDESRDVIPSQGQRVTRAHIATVTLPFAPRLGSSPVNQALANSNTARALLAGPAHNSALRGSIPNRHTLGSLGPPGHHTSSVFLQTCAILAVSRMTQARAMIER